MWIPLGDWENLLPLQTLPPHSLFWGFGYILSVSASLFPVWGSDSLCVHLLFGVPALCVFLCLSCCQPFVPLHHLLLSVPVSAPSAQFTSHSPLPPLLSFCLWPLLVSSLLCLCSSSTSSAECTFKHLCHFLCPPPPPPPHSCAILSPSSLSFMVSPSLSHPLGIVCWWLYSISNSKDL